MAIPKKEFRQRLRRLRDREDDLKYLREKLLRAAGWEFTASFPDHCWRWSKKIKGERFTTASPDEALEIESESLGE